jgi:polysaccharide deacetylase 2 family uncharacterized protein YibQ
VATLSLAVLAGVLQVLGPPPLAVTVAATPAPVVPPPPAAPPPAPAAPVPPPPAPPPPAPVLPAPAPPTPPPAPEPVAAPPSVRPAARLGGPIAAPDPGLLEAAPSYADHLLPRVGADGRKPMHVYAAGANAAETRPRIAVLLADFGLNEQDSDNGVHGLPPAVSFAVSPYGTHVERLLEAARARGHELFAVVPMEPSNYPLNFPGDKGLLTGATPGENALRLEWALSRFNGYVGVTAALGRMHGERFAGAPELYAGVLEEIGRRGLLYVDPRPGGAAPPSEALPPFRAVDEVIDNPAVRSEVDAALERLEKRARETGSALGLADTPTPMTIDRIAAWANALPVRGYALVPVSAIVAPP